MTDALSFGRTDGLVSLMDTYNMEYLMENYLEYHLRAIVTETGLKVLNKYISNHTESHNQS